MSERMCDIMPAIEKTKSGIEEIAQRAAARKTNPNLRHILWSFVPH